jgi:hypothetical protein
MSVKSSRSVKYRFFVLRKIIRGGQTGADRAGLDFATEVGLEHGGRKIESKKSITKPSKLLTRHNAKEATVEGSTQSKNFRGLHSLGGADQ